MTGDAAGDATCDGPGGAAAVGPAAGPGHRRSAEEVLTTTRAVRRRLDLDRPVDPSLLDDCVRVALQAPMGGNVPRVRFVLVTEPGLRASMAELYRACFAGYRHGGRYPTDEVTDDPVRRRTQERVGDSAEHLAEVLHRVPALVLACADGRPPDEPSRQPGWFGSVLPAVWSFMLAARDRDLGTCWTTMHLPREAEMAELLGIPYDRVTQVALVPTAHTLGDGFRPASRPALEEVRSWQGWTWG